MNTTSNTSKDLNESRNMDMETFLNQMDRDWDAEYLQRCFERYVQEGKSMSKESREELLRHYTSLSNNNFETRGTKRIGLLSLGLPLSEVDEMCEEKPIDKEAMLKIMSEQIVRDRRKWRREQRAENKRLQQQSAAQNYSYAQQL